MLNGDPRVLLSGSSSNNNINDYDLKEGEVSSGTTIMAIACGDAVVLGADSRVSTGSYVANRVSDKIAQLSEHIYCCRSGSAADTQFLTDVVKHLLQQLRCVFVVLCLSRCASWNVIKVSVYVVYKPNNHAIRMPRFNYADDATASRQADHRKSNQPLI